MRKTVLIKFIDSRASPAEQKEIIEWLDKSPENRKYFDRLKNLWVLSSLPQGRATGEEYKEFLAKYPVGNKKDSRKIYFWAFSALAASFLLLFFLIKPYMSSDFPVADQFANHVSNSGPDIRFQVLPDGSRVALYPGAELFYPDEFSVNRETFLTGQAFFEVAADMRHPLYVRTTGGRSVKVTGTRFYVKSVSRPESSECVFEASLFKGSILVEDEKTKTTIKMVPGDRVICGEGRELVKLKQDGEKSGYLQELESYFCFENEKIEEVTRRLGDYYNITFQYENPDIKDYVFTANICGQPLESVLNLFYRTMGIRHRTQDSTIILY